MANINDLQDRIRNFAEARDWERFHIPKNLCLALSAEIGELAAEFLWLSDSESMRISEEKKRLVSMEIADVAIYLLRLADILKIDVSRSVIEKLEINETRFPPLNS